jgi:hypothetical protein
MALKGSPVAEKVNEGMVISKGQIQLFDDKVVNDTTEQLSDGLVCRDFRKFLLYLTIDSTGSPTTIQIKVQYREEHTGKWYTYKQGIFAALFYEDTDTASGIWECFSGDCEGREMRITLTGVGTSGSAYFTVSATIEFRN